MAQVEKPEKKIVSKGPAKKAAPKTKKPAAKKAVKKATTKPKPVKAAKPKAPKKPRPHGDPGKSRIKALDNYREKRANMSAKDKAVHHTVHLISLVESGIRKYGPISVAAQKEYTEALSSLKAVKSRLSSLSADSFVGVKKEAKPKKNGVAPKKKTAKKSTPKPEATATPAPAAEVN